MGARQSTTEERPRSNSVDVASPSSSDSRQHASSSVVTAAELLQAIRQHTRIGSSSDSNDDEEATSSSVAHRPTRLRPRGVHDHPARYIMLRIANEDLQCPVCHKTVPSDEADVHLIMCLTRPKLSYNDDVLTDSKGECPICLDEMEVGQTIARLPCLCIYHKSCIDEWFKRKNCCPEHPGDD